MNVTSRWFFTLVAGICILFSGTSFAQAGSPTIRSFSVEQVPQLAPGTELIFRAAGTAGGTLTLQIDGVANQIQLPEASSGDYEGAYTISVRDKLPYNAKTVATLKAGQRQTTSTLSQTLLTPQAYAAAVAAATPAPVIGRIETRNSGAWAGGHEITMVVQGTPGTKASASFDGGKTALALAELKAGEYSGAYTIKTRDQFADTTPVLVTLASGAQKATATKPLAVGVFMVPVRGAPAAVAACEGCGVVLSVSKVKLKGKPNYVGAIAGGVAGAALGSQVGKGDGNTAATVVGALGGAVAGREIEKHVRSNTVYDVVVKLDDASTRTVRFEADPGFKAGSKVRLSGETLVARE